jgi:hypothetical protein
MVPSRLKICADVIDGCYSDYSLLDIGLKTIVEKLHRLLRYGYLSGQRCVCIPVLFEKSVYFTSVTFG